MNSIVIIEDHPVMRCRLFCRNRLMAFDDYTNIMTAYSGLLIAETLGLNHRTVDNILSCIYDKTGAKSRLDLMKW